MASLAPVLLSFPPDSYASKPPSSAQYDYDIRHHIKQLDSITASTFQKNVDTIELLNPAVNSAAYLYFLRALLPRAFTTSKTKQLPDDLWNKVVSFCSAFDPVQIRYLGHDWRKLIEELEQVARYASTTLPIDLMGATLLRMDPSGATYTSNHLRFLKLCLESDTPDSALPLLERHIINFPTNPTRLSEVQLPSAEHFASSAYITYKSGITEVPEVEKIQEYWMLGALIYISAERWKEALIYLEQILVTPTLNSATGLMLEAYRKWVLVALLVAGKPLSLPKGIHQESLRKIKAASKAYDNLAEVYKGGDGAQLQAEIDAAAAVWREDGNLGLVRRVFGHFTDSIVVNFSKTHTALPITDVAAHLNATLEATQTYLATLVSSGKVNAIVEQPDPSSSNQVAILRFHSDRSSGPLASSEEEVHAELLARKQRILELADQVKDTDRRLSVCKEWLEFAKKIRDRKEGGDGLATEMDWMGGGDDEDMMGDLR
ncbi:MAG: hypothetical protein M1820_008276 [Bogoriella megaspora]|nr:MAG: hypothetical protein M1820_008276 [Bogoriella megaspora]